MTDIWFVSDTHFNHQNILTFKNSDGSPVRSFSSLEEMNETMVKNWNLVVKPQDHVYHCGDVCMGPRSEYSKWITRLNGRLRLVVGNHDDLNNRDFLSHFEKVMTWRVFKDGNFLVSHVPVHPNSMMPRKCEFNVHGHLHGNTVKILDTQEIDRRYVNVCVERNDYTPIHFDEIVKRIKNES